MLITGGCLCGQVKYQTEGKQVTSFNCHCRDCQRTSGTGHISGIAVPSDTVVISGEIKLFESTGGSGNVVKRGFCPNCGSNLLGIPTVMKSLTVLTAGSLDQPELFKPKMAAFCDSALSWDQPAAEAIKFAEGFK